MHDERWMPVEEPLFRTLARNLTIAIVAGVLVSVFRRAPGLALPTCLLALWPALGGHFVELAFLNGVRPRLPRARSVQVAARLLWWGLGGALLGGALIATAGLLPAVALPWRWWWGGAPGFIGVELVAHLGLAVRGRPNFFRGDG